MAFCVCCGNQLLEDARFCTSCGKAVGTIVPAEPNFFDLQPYEGKERHFSFMGEKLTISPELDMVNHYRKCYQRLAKIQTDRFMREYKERIYDIDSYTSDYPTLFITHFHPIVETSVNLLMKMDIFDVSVERFEKACVENSCMVDAYKETVDLIEEAIEENREMRIQKYEQMPSLFFGGASGIAAAFAYNAVMNKIASNDISNADISDDDREEFAEALKDTRDDVQELFYLDCNKASIQLFGAMIQAGRAVWTPEERNDERCEGIFQNLKAGRIPMESLPRQVVLMMELNPFFDPHQLHYLKQCFGDREDTEEILEYFGYYI